MIIIFKKRIIRRSYPNIHIMSGHFKKSASILTGQDTQIVGNDRWPATICNAAGLRMVIELWRDVSPIFRHYLIKGVFFNKQREKLPYFQGRYVLFCLYLLDKFVAYISVNVGSYTHNQKNKLGHIQEHVFLTFLKQKVGWEFRAQSFDLYGVWSPNVFKIECDKPALITIRYLVNNSSETCQINRYLD